jgi:hypothetical protein
VADLNNHHRETLRKIFTHPSSGNVEWHQVLSLLEAVGTVTDEPNGKVRVTAGPESDTLPRPRHKDFDEGVQPDTVRRSPRSPAQRRNVSRAT